MKILMSKQANTQLRKKGNKNNLVQIEAVWVMKVPNDLSTFDVPSVGPTVGTNLYCHE